MNGKKILPILASLLVSLASSLEAQSPAAVELLPGTILFTPLTANLAEPRTGVRKQIGSSRMKLDIGSAMDLLEWRVGGDGARLRFGSDFFVYALTTSSQGFRLQVDAVDGYFGGHVSYAATGDPRSFALRLRLMHLSAHFLDGHFDNGTQQWKDGRLPIPFTKDFGELTGAWTLNAVGGSIRIYSGFAYATLIRPVEIGRLSTLHGFEYRNASLAGTFGGKPVTLYGAYHLSVTQISTVIGTNNIECGIKFGAWDMPGVRFYGSYYSGMELFSQYYNLRTDYWGVGFGIDLW